MKKFKNAQKTLLFSAAIWNTFLAWKTLKFGFSISEKVVDNWISFQKKPILNQLEFWTES